MQPAFSNIRTSERKLSDISQGPSVTLNGSARKKRIIMKMESDFIKKLSLNQLVGSNSLIYKAVSRPIRHLKDLKDISEANPTEPFLTFTLGFSLYKHRDLDGAIDKIESAQNDYKDVHPFLFLGNMYEEKIETITEKGTTEYSVVTENLNTAKTHYLKAIEVADTQEDINTAEEGIVRIDEFLQLIKPFATMQPASSNIRTSERKLSDILQGPSVTLNGSAPKKRIIMKMESDFIKKLSLNQLVGSNSLIYKAVSRPIRHLKDLKDISEANPTEPFLTFTLGFSLYKHRDLDGAIDKIESAQNDYKDVHPFLFLGNMYEEKIETITEKGTTEYSVVTENLNTAKTHYLKAIEVADTQEDINTAEEGIVRIDEFLQLIKPFAPLTSSPASRDEDS